METKVLRGKALTRDEVVTQYYNLLRKEANRHSVRIRAMGYEVDDLINVAAMGLLRAYDGFDESRGLSFMTYAVPTVRGAISRWFRDTGKLIKVSRPIKDASAVIFREGLEAEPVEVIMEHTGYSREMVNDALYYFYHADGFSLDKPIDDDKPEGASASSLAKSHDDMTDMVVREFFETLTDKEEAVVMGTMNGLSQTEIGKLIGVSQVQVSRILKAVQPKYEAYMNGTATKSPDKQKTNVKMEVIDVRDNSRTRVLDLHLEGKSVEEIVKLTGLKASTIKNYIANRKKWEAEQEAKIKKAKPIKEKAVKQEPVPKPQPAPTPAPEPEQTEEPTEPKEVLQPGKRQPCASDRTEINVERDGMEFTEVLTLVTDLYQASKHLGTEPRVSLNMTVNIQ